MPTIQLDSIHIEYKTESTTLPHEVHSDHSEKNDILFIGQGVKASSIIEKEYTVAPKEIPIFVRVQEPEHRPYTDEQRRNILIVLSIEFTLLCICIGVFG
jgi:hypothetical protein